MEPYKKQITVETHRRDEPNDTRIAVFRGVGSDCATRRRKPRRVRTHQDNRPTTSNGFSMPI